MSGGGAMPGKWVSDPQGTAVLPAGCGVHTANGFTANALAPDTLTDLMARPFQRRASKSPALQTRRRPDLAQISPECWRARWRPRPCRRGPRKKIADQNSGEIISTFGSDGCPQTPATAAADLTALCAGVALLRRSTRARCPFSWAARPPSCWRSSLPFRTHRRSAAPLFSFRCHHYDLLAHTKGINGAPLSRHFQRTPALHVTAH
jgi:hypothetical protein